MTGKTHATCGTISLLALAAAYPQGVDIAGYTLSAAIGVVTVAAGSLAPDVDLEQSSLGRRYWILSKIFTHRGMTHTLVFPIFLYALMVSVADMGIPLLPSLIFGFNFGWVVHILADLFNRKGVPLFWPIYRQRVHIATFLTNSSFNNGKRKRVPFYKKESAFLALWVGVNLAWIYSTLS